RRLGSLSDDELYVAAKDLQAPYDLVVEVARAGKLPVVLFTAGGIATPADAAMMMQLGAEGVFVGSGIFKSGDPAQRAAAIVKATTFFDDPDVLAKVSRGLGEAMVGINVEDIAQPHRLAERGWESDRIAPEGAIKSSFAGAQSSVRGHRIPGQDLRRNQARANGAGRSTLRP